MDTQTMLVCRENSVLKDAINEAWHAWVDPENTPAGACVESRLAHPDIRVEMKIEAAR